MAVSGANWREQVLPAGTGVSQPASVDSVYATPESQGTSRTKATYASGGGTGQDRETATRLAAFNAQKAGNQQQNVGDSRSAHFNDGANVGAQTRPVNGMMENPGIPRFGADANE